MIENYIEDVLTQLIEEAKGIKVNKTDDFQRGKLFGYYEAISKLLIQAESFGVAEKLPEHLRDFNPESLINYFIFLPIEILLLGLITLLT